MAKPIGPDAVQSVLDDAEGLETNDLIDLALSIGKALGGRVGALLGAKVEMEYDGELQEATAGASP